MIGDGELSWLVYPIETIIAEKLQTLVERGCNSSRAKDIYDLYFYLQKGHGESLETAILRCFEYRGTPIPTDLAAFLAKIDLSLLKQGWKSATATLQNPPSLEHAFKEIVEYFKNVPTHQRKRK